MRAWFNRTYDVDARIGHDAQSKRGSPRYFLRFTADDTEKLFMAFKSYFEQIPSMRQKFWVSFAFYDDNKQQASTTRMKI